MKRYASGFLTSLGLALMAAALVACHDDNCDDDVFIGAEADSIGFRDPTSGLCVSPPGPGPGTCGGFDRPLPAALEEAPSRPLAQCFGGCEGNDEITCVSAAGCRAIYQDDAFVDCWGTSPAGPQPGLPCEGLDAYSCSDTDHCSAVHDADGFFNDCKDERRPCTATVDCGGTSTCSTESAGECLSGPGCQTGTCDDVCWGFCSEPGNGGPGSCVGDVACDLAEPACPPGTVAGRTPECWTGFCIPIDSCDAKPACAGLTEPECTAASTCTSLYRGENCSCDTVSCTCTTYIYEGCGDA